ncbi:MAG TPA: hypothetical protein VMW57_05520 [Methyloceanibacter sp.]|nr:hypothetical protein [Methyloceanibacter sp.]
MTLELPIYAIAGQKPMYMFETESGGLEHLVWDFDKNDWVRGGANELDVLFGREAPGGGDDALRGDVPHQGGMDVRYVSETEFNGYVENLRKRAESSEQNTSN